MASPILDHQYGNFFLHFEKLMAVDSQKYWCEHAKAVIEAKEAEMR